MCVTAEYLGDSADPRFSLRHVFSHPSPETDRSRQLEAVWRSLVDCGAGSYKWDQFFDLTLYQAQGELSEAGLQNLGQKRLSKEMTRRLQASLLSSIIIHFSLEGSGYENGVMPGLQVLGYDPADFDRILTAGFSGTFNYTQGVRPIHPDRGLTIAFHNSVSENMARKIAEAALGVGPHVPLQPSQPGSEAMQRFLHEPSTDPSQYAEPRSQTLIQQIDTFNSSWPGGGTQSRVLPTLTTDPEGTEDAAGSSRTPDLLVSYSQRALSYIDPSWSATANNPHIQPQDDRLPELRSATTHRRRR